MTCTCKVCGLEKYYPEDFEKWPKVLKSKPEMFPICKNGNPDNKPSLFICDRCLWQANAMRTHIMSLVSGLIITEHAARRFVERIGLRLENASKAKKPIYKIFQKASKVKMKDKSALMMELNSNYVDAEYYLFQHIVFVVSGDRPKKMLLTVMRRGKGKASKKMSAC